MGFNPGGSDGPTLNEQIDVLTTRKTNAYLDEEWRGTSTEARDLVAQGTGLPASRGMADIDGRSIYVVGLPHLSRYTPSESRT